MRARPFPPVARAWLQPTSPTSGGAGPAEEEEWASAPRTPVWAGRARQAAAPLAPQPESRYPDERSPGTRRWEVARASLPPPRAWAPGGTALVEGGAATVRPRFHHGLGKRPRADLAAAPAAGAVPHVAAKAAKRSAEAARLVDLLGEPLLRERLGVPEGQTRQLSQLRGQMHDLLESFSGGPGQAAVALEHWAEFCAGRGLMPPVSPSGLSSWGPATSSAEVLDFLKAEASAAAAAGRCPAGTVRTRFDGLSFAARHLWAPFPVEDSLIRRAVPTGGQRLAPAKFAEAGAGAATKASVWVAAQCQFEQLAATAASAYVRELARDAAVIGVATLRLDDALSSVVQVMEPGSLMICGSMSGDKADRTRVSRAAGAAAPADAARRLLWFCPTRGVLGGWEWAETWASSRASQGFMLRAVTFPRGAATQRLASATGWGGQASAATAVAMFEEMLRMPPLAASQAELEAWRFTGAGFRHFLPNVAAALRVPPHVYNELGRWASSESGGRRVSGPSAAAAPMACRYATDARRSVEMSLRCALLQALQGAGAGQDWLSFWPRGPDWSQTAELVLAHAAAAELAEVAALGV